jgi:predicted GTPase
MTAHHSGRRIVICGAAGRDYHNFNVVYRDREDVEVVTFTATQIPGIEGRAYPPALAGERYPDGIPIVEEAGLDDVMREREVDEVVFAYSDVTHDQVMHLASRVLAAGASFTLLGPSETMLQSARPVIAVSAVRTGCGKSQVARYLSAELRARGLAVAAIRHPMPYGDLAAQSVQRFATLEDIAQGNCTIEEREEYEPHVASGSVIFAGVDYGRILSAADAEADLVLWDGGNNDFPFVEPDLHIVVTDALRPNQLTTHHPGEAVLKMADVVVINKVLAASQTQLAELAEGIQRIVPNVPVIKASSPVTLDDPDAVAGAKVLIVEDGPTITHGGMPHGAGYQAVKNLDVEIIDPRRSATADLQALYERFPHIGPVLPAMGYDPEQCRSLQQTIEDSVADVVIAGTPIDFARDVPVTKPVVRARYEYQDHAAAAGQRLMDIVDAFLKGVSSGR